MKPYNLYQAVNQRWLGSIPDSWTTTRLRFLCDIGTGSGDTVNADPEGDYPFIVRSPTQLRATKFDNEGEAILTVGDGAVGEVFHHIRDGRYLAHQRVYVLNNFRDIDSRFFFYYFSSLFHLMAKDGSARTTVDSVRRWMLTDMPVAVPPTAEQHAIADFLDRETARIDTLIEEQQRLIDLLRERRISLITRQVAGGYLEDFSRTQSNWYPNLPSSWQFGRVKSFATRVTDGAHISPNTNGGVYDFVSTRDINAGNIDYDGSLKTSPETYEHMVRTGCRPELGDVLFSKDGTVGETAIVDEHREFVVASSLVIISPDPARLMSEFLAYALMSKASRDQAASMMRGAGLPRISVANLGRLELPLPPLEQQRRIVNDLNDHTAMLDTLIAETEKFVDLARERRAALITAAVTGQIDVRDEVA